MTGAVVSRFDAPPAVLPPTPVEPRTAGPTQFERTISAAVGATVVALLVTPFDVVKTRMQTFISANSAPESVIFDSAIRRVTALDCIRDHTIVGKLTGSSLSGSDVGRLSLKETSALRPFRNTMDGFIRISHYEGIPALWKGLGPALVIQAPSAILYYLGYEDLRNWLTPIFPASTSGFYAPLFAGALARAATTIVISPLEMVRTRMQSGSGPSSTLSSVLQQIRGIVIANGPFSVFRGLGATLLRDVPFSAVYWTCYEMLKPEITKIGSKSHLKVIRSDVTASFATGALAGSFAAVITTPFDVAKTLQQVVHHHEPGADGEEIASLKRGSQSGTVKHGRNARTMGTVGVLRDIMRTDGFSGLFVGVGPRVAKIGPACAIMIASYEAGKRVFRGSG